MKWLKQTFKGIAKVGKIVEKAIRPAVRAFVPAPILAVARVGRAAVNAVGGAPDPRGPQIPARIFGDPIPETPPMERVYTRGQVETLVRAAYSRGAGNAIANR